MRGRVARRQRDGAAAEQEGQREGWKPHCAAMGDRRFRDVMASCTVWTPAGMAPNRWAAVAGAGVVTTVAALGGAVMMPCTYSAACTKNGTRPEATARPVEIRPAKGNADTPGIERIFDPADRTALT